MGKIKDVILSWFDSYALRVAKGEERRLIIQRNNAIKECQRCLGLLKRRKRFFREEINFIEDKIIPYIKRKKYMPLSYGRMLDDWEVKCISLLGIKEKDIEFFQ